jgi:hypothetical protein
VSLHLADVNTGTGVAIYLITLLKRPEMWPNSSLRLPARWSLFAAKVVA